MYKVIAIVISIACCSLCGFQNAGRLEKRCRLLKNLRDSVRRLSDMLVLTQKPIVPLIRGSGELPAGELFEAYAGFIEEGRDANKAWAETRRWMKENEEYCGLDEQHTKAVGDFLMAFSLLEGTQLRTATEQACARLSELCVQAQTESEKKGKVYRTMGVLVGAAVAILLI